MKELLSHPIVKEMRDNCKKIIFQKNALSFIGIKGSYRKSLLKNRLTPMVRDVFVEKNKITLFIGKEDG